MSTEQLQLPLPETPADGSREAHESAGDASALVWPRLPSAPGAPAWVVCPRPGAPVPEQVRCVLLRSSDLRIWMFELAPICLMPMAHVLEAIARDLAGSPDAGEAARGLRFVAEPVLDRVEPRQWKTRDLAFALASYEQRSPGEQPPSQHVDRQQQCIHDELAIALAAFGGGLDAQALALARRGSAVDAEVYNYLVQAPHRRNRMQFAQVFPLLVYAAAHTHHDARVQLLRRLVDEGRPLIKALVKGWGVAPGALRCLRFRSPDVLGRDWERKPFALLAILDAIAPADRAASAAGEWWRSLGRAAAIAGSVCGTAALSKTALVWIACCARNGWRGLLPEQPRTRLALAEHGTARLFLACLVEAVRHAAEAGAPLAQAPHGTPDADTMARAAAYAQLCRLPDAQRERTLERFAEMVSGQIRSRWLHRSQAQWRNFPALLPHDVASACETRVLRCVTTPAQLQEMGRALVNCLRDLRHRNYALSCAVGESFIVAVCDARSTEPLSLAEFRTTFVDDAAEAVLRLVQHRAARNDAPSTECRRAITELARQLDSGSYRDHLHALVDFSVRRGCGARALDRDIRAGALRRAIVDAVGSATLDAMAADYRALMLDRADAPAAPPEPHVAPGQAG